VLTSHIFNEVDLKGLVICIVGVLPKLKTLTSLVMSPKVNLMDPFLQFMIVLAVTRNGHPKMTGVWDLGLDTGCVSKIMKSTG